MEGIFYFETQLNLSKRNNQRLQLTMLQIGIYPLHLRMQSSHLPPRLLLDSTRTRAIPFLPAYGPTSATCPRSRCTTRHVSVGPRHRNLRWPGCRRLPRPRHRSPVYTQMMYYHHYYWHTVWVVIQLQIVHGIGGQNVFCALICTYTISLRHN